MTGQYFSLGSSCCGDPVADERLKAARMLKEKEIVFDGKVLELQDELKAWYEL